MPITDRELRPGNQDDFDALYRAMHGRLFRTLLGVVSDPADAEDCVQETFVRAFKAWPRWKPDAPVEAWLHRIAINVAVSHRRKQRLLEVGELVRRIGGLPASPVRFAEAERLELVMALRSLRPKLAAAVVLRHYHGYNNREIAAALGVSERTIGARLAQATEHLRELLAAQGEVDLPTWQQPRVKESVILRRVREA
jgi:RNA polymerase sigma-70 factor (ECF subfamily)